MGHDISAANSGGELVAYARFSMWNRNADVLYDLLGAEECNAGVSGSGEIVQFSLQQIENALTRFTESIKNGSALLDHESGEWDQKQIMEFLVKCLETAKKEGSVNVYFA